MNRIICIGNRFLDRDAAGPRVFDALSRHPLPEGVELFDGGTAGLNLLGIVDGAERVIFVDAVEGFLPQAGITVLDAADVPPPAAVYDHGAGLSYLLNVIPAACDRAPSSIFVVCIEGAPEERLIAEAARTSICLASVHCGETTGSGGKP